MRVQFVKRDNMPERLVAEAEIVFDDDFIALGTIDNVIPNPLVGLRLVGFSVWEAPDGDLYVTFPARAFGAGGDRRYFDYLRPIEGEGASAVKRFKSWILSEYKNSEQ